MKLFSKLAIFSFAIWLFCLIADIVIFVIVIFIRKELFNTTPNIFAIPFFALLLVGCLTFAVGVISFIASHIVKTGSKKKENIIKKLLKFIAIIAIFPIFIAFQCFKPIEVIKKLKHSGIRSLLKTFKTHFIAFTIRFVLSILLLAVLFPTWIMGYFITGLMIREALGYNPRAIPIAGTGSMYPTFPKSYEKDKIKQYQDIIGIYDFTPYPNGIVLFGKRYFGYDLHKGDIVSAENEVIKANGKKLYGVPSGVIKRIIAMPGDSLEIRSGLVYLNSKPLIESYTAKPHSTFGETFLGECKKITIPNNKLFIMGDNRKGSGDSREFGLVDIKDIKSVIPFNKQKGKYDKNYRDTSKDLSNSTKIKLDKKKYLELLNAKRKEAGVQLLKYQPLLEKSAGKRGEVILKFDDFSFEATKSGTTMEQAMYGAGYSNTTWGEAPTQGYYEADELMENQFEYPKSKEFLLNKDYQEVGIAEVEGEINGCPTQVVIQHFAGYIPPNYKKEDIEAWKTNLSKLKEIQPGWSGLKNSKDYYERNKQDVDRINEVIRIRIANMEAIVNKMESNRWLNKQETDFTYNDKNLFDEQERLATKLNGK